MRKAGRLPPGQLLTEKFPVLHYGAVPRFDPDTWNFRVWGKWKNRLRLTYQEFMAVAACESTVRSALCHPLEQI